MERWQQIESLFQEALQRDPAERDAYVREARRGDSDLRREVASLLANHHEGIDSAPWAAAAAADLIVDQTVVLDSVSARTNYPDTLRRIHYYDAKQDRHIRFLTKNFDLPAFTICLLYKSRWQVELFFKWIKQHLRIKVFYGTSENAVKTQVWVAISIYVLIAIVKKRHELEPSLFQILQILSITVFEQAHSTGIRRGRVPRKISRIF